MKKRLNTLNFILISALLIISISGSATTYYSKSTGNLNTLSTWGDALIGDGSGNAPGSFNTTNNFVICNRSSETLSPTFVWVFNITSTLTIGDGNPITLVLNSGIDLRDMTIDVSSSATVILNDDPANLFTDANSNPLLGFRNVDANSTIIFNSNGGTIPVPHSNSSYGNIIINNFSTLLGSIQTETLQIAATKTLDLSNFQVQILQNIAGSGSISAISGTVYFNLSTTGNKGTLFLDGPIKTLRMLGTQLAYVTLGSDVTVTGSGGTFLNNANSGLYDLNGHTLTLDNAITLGGTTSFFKGSSGSAIRITGSGTITNPTLRFDPSFNILKSLELNRSSANLSIGSNMLNITDNVSVIAGTLNTGGFLTLKSTSALKGRIGPVGGTISGNVTVETFIPGPNTGWAQLGISGVQGQAINSWSNTIPMACNGCPNPTTSVGSGFNSIQGWNEVTGAYDESIVFNSSLIPGKGFWIYVGSSLNSTTDFVLSNTGLAVQGASTIPLSKTTVSASFNLISNPYASPISWTALTAIGTNTTKVANAIYSWNADLNGGTGGQVEFAGGVSTPVGITGMSDVIPAGQGFYVEALSTTNLDYNETAKSTANTSANPLLKPASPVTEGIVRLRLGDVNNYGDEAVIRIHPSATGNFDYSWDAHKILQSPGYVGYPGAYSLYTTLSSKDTNGDDYAIQSIPPISGSVISIPILARVIASGTYSIAATEYDTDVSSCLILMDNLLGQSKDLKTGPYIFTISDTTSAPRFELILCKDESLNAVGISEKNEENSFILISQNEQGAFVKTVFEKTTKASISVFNIIGQKLCKDILVEGTITSTQVPVDLHNQVVLIKVTTDKESVTKKVVLH